MLSALAILSVAATQWICPARFAPLPSGWTQGNLGSMPADMPAFSWARTRGFDNLTDIPRNGVYVWTLLSPRLPTSPAPSWRRPLRPPLDLRHPDQVTVQEGSPLPELRFAGRYKRLYYVDVRVDFGRRHPTRAVRERTQTLLTRLRLPPRLMSTPACPRGMKPACPFADGQQPDIRLGTLQTQSWLPSTGRRRSA